jgi:hypothetical protein
VAVKLSSRQQAQLAWLELLPRKLDRVNTIIELMSTNQADDMQVRAASRLLDEMKAQASGLGVAALSDTFGYMGTLLRRTGAHQMRVRGLRELLAGARVNFEGAMRSATTPETPGEPPSS